jgi:hypothetical protein
VLECLQRFPPLNEFQVTAVILKLRDWAVSRALRDYGLYFSQNRAENRGCPDTGVGLTDEPTAVERFRAIESVCGRIDHSI